MTTKYCIKYNDGLLHGHTDLHKKSGLLKYNTFVFFLAAHDNAQPLLFTSELQAKIFLLFNSSIQMSKHLVIDMIGNEALVDKAIAKGKYRFSRGYMRNCDIGVSESERFCSKKDQYPLLCEFIIDEYPYELQPKQGQDVDNSERSDG